jgi:hypothetical protein
MPNTGFRTEQEARRRTSRVNAICARSAWAGRGNRWQIRVGFQHYLEWCLALRERPVTKRWGRPHRTTATSSPTDSCPSSDQSRLRKEPRPIALSRQHPGGGEVQKISMAIPGFVHVMFIASLTDIIYRIMIVLTGLTERMLADPAPVFGIISEVKRRANKGFIIVYLYKCNKQR